MTDKTEAMDNLIAQDADLIETCSNDLVQRLFTEADNFKVDREVGMRAMLYRAADRIEALTAENERLRDYWYRQGKDDQHQVDADRIEAQAAEIERLNKSAECLAETRQLAVKDVAELEAENERLRGVIRQAIVDGDVKASPLPPRAALEARGLEIREKGQ